MGLKPWRANTGLFEQLARGRFGIPGIISPVPEKIDSNVAFVALLGVGENLPVSLPTSKKRGTSFSISDTLPNLWALRLYNYIEGVRGAFRPEWRDAFVKSWADQNGWVAPNWLEKALAVPPFSQEVCEEWFAVAWEIVMEASDGKPEAEPYLKPIGQSAGKKKPKFCMEIHEGTKNSNVRAKIKARLKAAFRILAPSANPLDTSDQSSVK